MQAHRTEATVQSNGKIVLENLPFDEGEAVEIIVLETKNKKETNNQSLRGTLLNYEQPFEPVAVEDWDALK